MGSDLEPDGPTLAERRRLITDLVHRHGFVQVRRLAELLNVSEVTIRLDLRELDESGGVKRVRGGARASRPTQDRGRSDRVGRAVGAMAAAFVRRGDTIILDGHAGVDAVARALVARADLSGVTVHTEAIHALPGFAGHEDRLTVVVPPGTLRPGPRVVPDRGRDAGVDLAIICCTGVSLTGLWAPTAVEAAAYRRAARVSSRTVAVIPAGGFDQPHGHDVCPLDQVDACLTEEPVPDAVASPLRAAGLRLFTAS